MLPAPSLPWKLNSTAIPRPLHVNFTTLVCLTLWGCSPAVQMLGVEHATTAALKWLRSKGMLKWAGPHDETGWCDAKFLAFSILKYLGSVD